MKKGFTLIELLIVIGILAILSSAVVVVLNPAQLFAQARDTQRLNDLATLQSAIAYYLSTTSVTSNYMAPNTAGNTCASNWWASFVVGGNGPFTAVPPASQSTQVSRAVNGTGWIPMNFSTVSGGAVLSTLPVDPTNSTTNYYAYSCNEADKLFELDTVLESAKYSPMMTNAKDGGDAASFYETGSKLIL